MKGKQLTKSEALVYLGSGKIVCDSGLARYRFKNDILEWYGLGPRWIPYTIASFSSVVNRDLWEWKGDTTKPIAERFSEAWFTEMADDAKEQGEKHLINHVTIFTIVYKWLSIQDENKQ